MKSYNIIYSEPAQTDIFGIYSYIATQLCEPQIAIGVYDRIRNAVRGLQTLPNRFIKVDYEPWQSMGMRKMPVDKYIVFYIVDESSNEVQIVRIVYGGRNIKNVLNKAQK